MKRILAISFFLSSVLFTYAQTINGFVRDKSNKEALAFTNISINGKSTGSISNIEGEFVLDIAGLPPDAIVLFSHIGYETRKITVVELKGKNEVLLNPMAFNLQTVEVTNKQLSAKQIVALVEENYEDNHPHNTMKQKIFFHNYEKTPWPDENNLNVKKSDFAGLDKQTLQQIFDMMPNEFIEYYDAMVEIYSKGDEKKLVPIEGISLEEGGQKDLYKEMEDKLTEFYEDIESSLQDEDVYYKFRTGILSTKMDVNTEDSNTVEEMKKDTLHYPISSSYIRGMISNLLKNYASLEGKNWEFIEDRGKYRYKRERVTVYNEELVYEISFTPKGRGLYRGVMYVSTDTYGILQMKYQYDEGKRNERFNMFGIKHAMMDKNAHIVFEKIDSSYYVKYINAGQHEMAAIDRVFSILKKRKRFMMDKKLNQAKMGVELYFDIHSSWELLVFDREEISEEEYKNAEEPKKMKFRKEYAYSPEMWNSTVLTPTSELKEYKRSK